MSKYRNTDHEALAIVAKHRELFPLLKTHNIAQLRAAAAALEAKPKAQASKRELSTAELVAEAAALTEQVKALTAARAASAPASQKGYGPSGDMTRDEWLDSQMRTGSFAANAPRVVQNDLAVQRFGVRAK